LGNDALRELFRLLILPSWRTLYGWNSDANCSERIGIWKTRSCAACWRKIVAFGTRGSRQARLVDWEEKPSELRHELDHYHLAYGGRGLSHAGLD
jgi:hypothetical protein